MSTGWLISRPCTTRWPTACTSRVKSCGHPGGEGEAGSSGGGGEAGSSRGGGEAGRQAGRQRRRVDRLLRAWLCGSASLMAREERTWNETKHWRAEPRMCAGGSGARPQGSRWRCTKGKGGPAGSSPQALTPFNAWLRKLETASRAEVCVGRGCSLRDSSPSPTLACTGGGAQPGHLSQQGLAGCRRISPRCCGRQALLLRR
jgi:hypothetical protein